MTPKQFFERFKADLRAMVWTGTANKIFGNAVFVTPGIPIMQIGQYQSPSCFLIDSSVTPDPEHPGLLYQKGMFVLYVRNVASNYGEGAMLSANRTANTSQGVGSFDLAEEVVLQIIKKITLTTKILLVEKAFAKHQYIKGNLPLVFRVYTFEILLSIY